MPTLALNSSNNIGLLQGHTPLPGIYTKYNAYRNFAASVDSTESQKHIKPVHMYLASRLVIEGGFNPDAIRPRPPLRIEYKKDGKPKKDKSGGVYLFYDADSIINSEDTILGGIKTKAVDVTVSIGRMGPLLAISCKGWTGARKNLTNRLEEAVGECSNLHIAYPSLVMGYMFLMRAHLTKQLIHNRASVGGVSPIIPNNHDEGDALIDFQNNAEVATDLARQFQYSLSRLSGRTSSRTQESRYEACALELIECQPYSHMLGHSYGSFPLTESGVRESEFFETLYRVYDERYVLPAPQLRKFTSRMQWSTESPAMSPGFNNAFGYIPRIV